MIGAGAIGGWLAARLALSGAPVAALSRRGPVTHIEIAESGRVETATCAGFDGATDLLIVAVKATALSDALPAIADRIGPDTIVVPALNGVPWWFGDKPLRAIDPDGAIAGRIPDANVIGCVVHASASRSGSGSVRVNHVDRLILGEPAGGASGRVAATRALFENAGIPCHETPDIRSAIWYKLWGNATINPLSALTRAPCDAIIADPECRSWMLEGMEELRAIGLAIGCPIKESGEARMAVTERLGAFKTSMLQDIESGKPIELDALLGAPIELARRNAIETPALNRLYGAADLLRRSLG